MLKAEFEEMLEKHDAWLQRLPYGERAIFKDAVIPPEYLSNRLFNSVIFKSICFAGDIHKAQFFNCVFDDCNVRTNVSMTLIDCDVTNLSVPRHSSGIVIM